MEIEIKIETPWARAYRAALRTAGKEVKDPNREPSRAWRREMLIAEHSPIKLVEFEIRIKELKQWIGVHLLRHNFLLPFIHSQRDDRNGFTYNRDELPQGTPNDHDFVANAQTLINMSRRRLCNTSHKETVAVWREVKEVMKTVDPDVAAVMVPNCVYSGFCRERKKCCGYVNTQAFAKEREEYMRLIWGGEEEKQDGQ